MDSMDTDGIPVLAIRRPSIGYLARFAAVIGVILGAFLWAPTTAQAITVDEVATQLRAQNVYNDPAAQNALTSSQVGDYSA
jgi:hypothetical protein